MANIKDMETLAKFVGFTPIDGRKRKNPIYRTFEPFLGDAELEYQPYCDDAFPTRESEFGCASMLFDCDWEWLMPVIQKIVEIEGDDFLWQPDGYGIRNSILHLNIKSAFDAVVKHLNK